MTGASLLILLLIFGLVGLALGKARQQHPAKCFLVGALLGPLGWLLVLVSKPDRSFTRECPACLSQVPRAASACRNCGRDLPVFAA
jgi:hypothetical protein